MWLNKYQSQLSFPDFFLKSGIINDAFDGSVHSVEAMWDILFPFFIVAFPKPICNLSPPKSSLQAIERDDRGDYGVAPGVTCLPSRV